MTKELSEHYEDLGDYGQKYFITYSLLFIFMFVHNTNRLQLAHTTLMKYQPFSKIYIFVNLSLLIVAIVAAATDGEADVRLAITIITCMTAFFQWAFLIRVAHEITKTLDISVFLTW